MSTPHPTRRLLIFQEARNTASSELVYLPVNKLGLPICGPGPELPSILELPLRALRAFTEIFNQPKYKGWYVHAYSVLRQSGSIGADSLLTGRFFPLARIMIPLRRANSTRSFWNRRETPSVPVIRRARESDGCLSV